MVVRHGLDLIDCKRIASMLERHGRRFLDRILTQEERKLCEQHQGRVTFVAGRWAAKEAILKMIGTGWSGNICWTDMEILPDERGRPLVRLSGETARISKELGLREIHLSITHTKEYAAASAIGVG
jgi:holo-[acyl-carrier protein] synthase